MMGKGTKGNSKSIVKLLFYILFLPILVIAVMKSLKQEKYVRV